jgi:hypothetical protein
MLYEGKLEIYRTFSSSFFFFFSSFFFFFFFFSFGVLQLMLPELPQPNGLLYYRPYWTFQISTPVPRCHSP